MTNPFSTSAAQNFGLLLARATLGVYFAAVGYKGIMMGVRKFADLYINDLPTWVTRQYGEAFLTLYPVLQLAAGILLALGVLTRVAAFSLASLLLIFMVCITGFQAPAGMPFEPNVIFLAVAIALLTNGGGGYTLPAMLGKKGAGAKPAAAPPAPAK
jgi:uncharacterized membrane protein YphA (DoxX/SURF4 family)